MLFSGYPGRSRTCNLHFQRVSCLPIPPPDNFNWLDLICMGERSRSPGLLVPNQAFYQLNYTHIFLAVMMGLEPTTSRVTT